MSTWTALDPLTLADRPGSPRIGSVEEMRTSWVASADGSTLTRVHNPETETGTTVAVFDGRTLAERHAYHLADDIGVPLLSADGSRMLVELDTSGSTWQLRDTATGRLLTTVKTAATSGGAPFGSGAITWMDPQARHLYQLVPTGSADATTPLPAALLSYDLRTGTLDGHLPLPQVHVESWQSWIAAKQLPVFHTLRPGVAIAPDGRTIAIVHADEEAVTLIDAASLRVERTVPLAPHASLLRRLLSWLSLAPAATDAKGLEGTTLQAVFAADGRHLYVWGQSGSVDAKGNVQFNSLGLTLVDLDSGEIVAKALAGSSIFRVAPALDGKNLYVLTSDQQDTLWRLDATTLAAKTRRSFDQPREIMVMPSVMIAD